MNVCYYCKTDLSLNTVAFRSCTSDEFLQCRNVICIFCAKEKSYGIFNLTCKQSCGMCNLDKQNILILNGKRPPCQCKFCSARTENDWLRVGSQPYPCEHKSE